MEKIDPQNPATLSSKVINDILRNDLEFNGVVITDDMTMGVIVKNYDIGDAAVKSVNAGSDIVLVCHRYENMIKVIDALKQAYKNGVIDENRINESVYRILKLKEKYGVSDDVIKTVDVNRINESVDAVLKGKIK
jgi:beta-N-acetylhexosaminidase